MSLEACHPDASRLWVCPACTGGFVHHTEAEPVEDMRWRLVLRCPDCEWRHEGIHAHADVLRYDRELEDAEVLIARALEILERDNMSDWAERFATALRAGALVPADF